MKLRPCESLEALTAVCTNWLEETSTSLRMKDIYLAAGQSPLELYRHIQAHQPSYLADCRLIQVDDIINGPKKHLFKRYFQTHLQHYQTQFHWITADPIQGDAAILGLGVNGHIAFHEPEMPSSFSYGEVALSQQTCITLDLSPGTCGLSYGLGHFMNCKRLLLIVLGNSKKDAFQRTLDGDLSIPAGHLSKHPDLSITYLDDQMG